MAVRNIAMFLGAGASKAFNYPLTKELLALVITGINKNTLFADAVGKKHSELYRQLLKELLINLSPGLETLFSKAKIGDIEKLPFITDLLSQVEHLYNSGYALTDFNFEIKNPLLGTIATMNARWSLRDVIALLELAIIKVINKGNVRRTADEWIIVGYSMPGEDLDIKSLFIRALKGREKKPVIKVIQETRRSEIKYDYFFGKGNYTFIDGGFEKYNFSCINVKIIR